MLPLDEPRPYHSNTFRTGRVRAQFKLEVVGQTLEAFIMALNPAGDFF
jgi:hypothetical protein